MSVVNNYEPPRPPTESYLDPVEPYDINFCLPIPASLETDRVKLAPFNPSIHGKPFFTAYDKAQDSLGQYLPISLTTYQKFLAYLEGVRVDPNAVLFAIIDKTRSNEGDLSACLAGVIGFLNTAKDNFVVEIAPVIILPTFQRTFVTTNAIGILLKYCLDLPPQGGIGFRRVTWTAHQNNQASVKAAERMGMKREGHLRWTWAISSEKIGEKCGEGRGDALGRDSILLAICWDDWERGTREEVKKLVDRL
ncbi:acyl-CoA N-acyltransferase [Collybia nuda]|uniref:Acyl-CoA N-acyltransferase n=1 Tax=Collybia nuda TaxID=64659 RepID=A0A9P5YI89_9AGAR|nr:acyl-CoA N-acyltransferase [Collybia nuda]